MQRAIALVDVNNFYASCERVFNPKLDNQAVVVLSNNDGCAIARSARAKELGIRMGEPYFKIKEAYSAQKVIALSSNYTLYADMSNRVMSIIGSYAPTQEVYSIDESFLDLTGITQSHIELGRQMRAKIKQWTGLPVCVGIGCSKTLAKLANHVAKKQPQYDGVCDFNQLSENKLDNIMSKIDVGEVWGVGRRLSIKLNQLNINTVLELKRANPEFMRQQFSVVMEKTVRELNGSACMELEEITSNKHEIVSSRSFGVRVRELQSLEEAVAAYTSKTAEKLRKQSSLAGGIRVFIRTSPFGDGAKYANSILIPIPVPTDDSVKLVRLALWALRKIYKIGYDYQKAGVMLTDLTSRGTQQLDIFTALSRARSENLMATLDAINSKMGRGAVRIAKEGFSSHWHMRQNNKSKCATTDWNQLVMVS